MNKAEVDGKDTRTRARFIIGIVTPCLGDDGVHLNAAVNVCDVGGGASEL